MLLAGLTLSTLLLAQAAPTCSLAAAEEQLVELDARFAAFEEQGLDEARLARSLKAAVKEQQELTRGYQRVAARPCGRASIDALVMIARTTEALARKLLESPTPEALAPDQVELYRTELEARAQPLVDHAATLYEEALRQARAQGVTSERIQLAERRVKALAPR